MIRLLYILVTLPAAILLWGCGDDLDPEDVLYTTTPPQVAASPVFERPIPGTPVYSYVYERDRALTYQHSGSSPYSAAGTELRDSESRLVAAHQNRPMLPQHNYYQESVINQKLTPLPYDGRFTVKATYLTQSAHFHEYQGVREVSGNRPFRVCWYGDATCIPTGGILQRPEADEDVELAGKPINCPPGDPDMPPDDPGCSGGGGGPPPLWFHSYRRHTASMGPFFAASNIGGSASQSDIENILGSLSPTQLDGIADIIWQAYGENVYDYFRVPPEAIEAALLQAEGSFSNEDESPFLAFLAPLDAADRSALGLVESLYLDRLLQLRDEYLAAADDRGASRGATTTATALTPATPEATRRMGDGPMWVSATVWPNPASDRLYIRVHGGQVAAVAIYDMQGRLVARKQTVPQAQQGVVEWDLRAASGRRVPAGVYQVVLTGEDGARQSVTVTVL